MKRRVANWVMSHGRNSAKFRTREICWFRSFRFREKKSDSFLYGKVSAFFRPKRPINPIDCLPQMTKSDGHMGKKGTPAYDAEIFARHQSRACMLRWRKQTTPARQHLVFNRKQTLEALRDAHQSSGRIQSPSYLPTIA